MLIRLSSPNRLGEMCVWESGECDVVMGRLDKGSISDTHSLIATEDEFHQTIADLFLWVVDRPLSQVIQGV